MTRTTLFSEFPFHKLLKYGNEHTQRRTGIQLIIAGVNPGQKVAVDLPLTMNCTPLALPGVDMHCSRQADSRQQTHVIASLFVDRPINMHSTLNHFISENMLIGSRITVSN